MRLMWSVRPMVSVRGLKHLAAIHWADWRSLLACPAGFGSQRGVAGAKSEGHLRLERVKLPLNPTQAWADIRGNLSSEVANGRHPSKEEAEQGSDEKGQKDHDGPHRRASCTPSVSRARVQSCGLEALRSLWYPG